MLWFDSLTKWPNVAMVTEPVADKCVSSSYVFYSSWSVLLPSLDCCRPEWLLGPSCPDLC